MKDIRQSKNWAKYLQSLGWNYETIDGTLVYYRSAGIGGVIKIQRPENITTQTLKKIDDLAKKTRSLFVKCEPLENKDIEVLLENGYERSFFPLVSPSSIFHDLTESEEIMWKRLNKDARRSVKRSEAKGMRIDFYRNASEDIQKKAWELLHKVGAEKKFYVQPFSDFHSKVKIWGENSIVSLTHIGDEVESMCLVLLHENNAFYIHAGASEKGKEYYAAYKQLWGLLLYLKSIGVQKADLEGIADERFPNFTKKWEGFSLFKKKFGGDIVKFPSPYIKYYSKIFQIMKKVVNPLPL